MTPDSETRENTTHLEAHPRPLDVQSNFKLAWVKIYKVAQVSHSKAHSYFFPTCPTLSNPSKKSSISHQESIAFGAVLANCLDGQSLQLQSRKSSIFLPSPFLTSWKYSAYLFIPLELSTRTSETDDDYHFQNFIRGKRRSVLFFSGGTNVFRQIADCWWKNYITAS